MAWLAGYNYRKAITLSRASGAVTDYQMKLLVGESSGAAGEDVDCGGNVFPGFDDLAFTASDETTLLNHWIESVTGVTPNRLATVWIKFDSIGTGNTTFYMYYGGSAVVSPIDSPVTGRWERYSSNPVLVVGAGGQWDDFWVHFHSIWKEGSTYYGYYSGAGTADDFQIGLATSSDGIIWTKSGSNPVLAPGAAGKWDDYAVIDPTVWKEGSTWYMLYSGESASGGEWRIGLATSSDGVSWTRYDVDNPVITVTGAAWDSFFVTTGQNIIKEGSTYYLYYWGGTSSNAGDGNWKIGLATSTDLHTWSKSGNNPLMSPTGTGWEQGGLLEPFVMLIGATYYMWYQGENSGGTRTKIGLASSAAKDSGWSRYGNNPVLDNQQDSATAGTSGTWDDAWAEVPIVIQVGNEWRLYFGGSQGAAATPRMQSGYATYVKCGSGVNTFLLFDDFHGATLNATLWNNLGSFTQDKDGVEKYASNTNTVYLLKSQSTYTGPLAVEAKLKVGSDWVDEYSWVFALVFDTDWATTGYLGGHFKDASNDYTKVYKFGTGATSNGTNEAIATNTYYRYSLLVGATTQKLLVNGTQKGSIAVAIQTNPANVILGIARATATSAYTSYFDYVFARQYLDTEPAWGAWGDEVFGGSASLSPSSSPSGSLSNSPSVSPSISFSSSPSVSPSGSPSTSPSGSPSLSPSASISPSQSTSMSPSTSLSNSPSGSPSTSLSSSPSLSPSVSFSNSPSVSPSASVSPSISPSSSPSISPSISPSTSLSSSPSISPSVSPSASPSQSPSLSPSASVSPSVSPSASPSTSPSVSPSASPSASLSISFSASPSFSPSASFSVSPSKSPSLSPSSSVSPSASPSISPSVSPSVSPSGSPSVSPSGSPSQSLSVSPSASPSISPSFSVSPSVSPSISPSVSPSPSPSTVIGSASISPSVSPSGSLSISPSGSPSASPSNSPSLSPSESMSPSTSPSRSPSLSPSASPSIPPGSDYLFGPTWVEGHPYVFPEGGSNPFGQEWVESRPYGFPEGDSYDYDQIYITQENQDYV